MSRKTLRNSARKRADAGRRRFLLGVPALLAGAWLVGTGQAEIEAPRGPRLLGLDQADLYGPHNLAG
jgi:hypothetical protein